MKNFRIILFVVGILIIGLLTTVILSLADDKKEIITENTNKIRFGVVDYPPGQSCM